MTWFKVDDGLHSHPKWLAVPPAARALWVSAGSWCAAHLTDGHVPRHALPGLAGKPRDAAQLVAAGMWDVDGDGWRFHDWQVYQPTAAEVRAERDRKASAGRLGGLASAKSRKQKRGKSEAGASSLAPERDTAKPDGSHAAMVSDADSSETATVPATTPSSGAPARDDGVPPLTSDNGANRRSRNQARGEADASQMLPEVPNPRPDPTRPDDNRGGENVPAAANHAPPPRRCQQHTNDTHPPPCGACADARRAHDAWHTQRAEPVPGQPSVPMPPPVDQVLDRYRDVPIERDGKGLAAAKAALRGRRQP